MAKITLRPKQAASPSPPAAPVAPASPPATPGDSAPPAGERPRLKPRLAVEPPAPAQEERTPAPESAADSHPPGEAAPAQQPVAAAGAVEAPKFKLKPKSAEPVPATLPIVSAALPPEAPQADLPEAPPEPVAEVAPEAPAEAEAEPASPSEAPAAPPVPKLKISLPRPSVAAPTSEDPNARPPPPVPAIKKRRRPSKLILFAAVAVVVVLLGAAYFVFFPSEPPPPVIIAQPRPKPPAPLAGAPAAANQPAGTLAAAKGPAVSLPGRMVEKAQGTVAKNDAALDASDGVLDKRPPAGSAPVGSAGKPAVPAVDNQVSATSAIAPGISATNSDVVATTSASPAFRTWAANAKISGVSVKDGVARALINGRTVRTGQVVDDTLGILFFSLDSDNGVIVFKDKTGVTVERKYY